MPLILAPYTLGAQLPADPAAGLSGGAFFIRRKRLVVTLCLLLVLLAC